jgi:hypothetical protein
VLSMLALAIWMMVLPLEISSKRLDSAQGW